MLLTETYICISITILYTNDIVANNCYSRTIAKKLFICLFCVVFLCFNKLMIKILIVFLSTA